MKGSIKKLVALVLVLAIAIGFYIWLSDYKKSKNDDAESEEKEEVAFEISQDDIVSIKCKKDKSSYTLKYNKDKDSWYIKGNESWPVNQDTVATMLSSISKISSTRTLKKENLSEYGLDKPSLDITIQLGDKKETKYNFKLGSEVPGSLGNYCMIKGRDKIYAINSDVKVAFDHTKAQLLTVDEIKGITSSLVYDVDISGKKLNLKAKFDGDIKEAENGKWKITKPYPVTMEGITSNFTDYFTSYETLSYIECVDYGTKNLKKYGLDKPSQSISLKYLIEEGSDSEEADKDKTEEKKKTYKKASFSLLIGKHVDADDDNDGASFYYVMEKGKKKICKMEASLVEGLINKSAFEFIFNAFNNTDWGQYKSVNIKFDDKKYTFKKIVKKEKNKDGEEVVDYSYKANDKKLAEDKFNEVMNSVTSLIYAKDIGDKKISKDKVIATFEYKGKDGGAKDTTIKVLNYDDNYYRVNTDGKEYFLISKIEMDNALKEIKYYNK